MRRQREREREESIVQEIKSISMQISKYFSVTVAAIEGYEISDRNTRERYRVGINSMFCEINGIFRGSKWWNERSWYIIPLHIIRLSF